MTVREKLFSEVETLCKDTGLDSKMTSQELSELIGEEEVFDYCATRGPLPSYPDTVFDILVLSKKFLHDYEMKQQGLLHHILPLRTILGVTESFEKKDEEEFLSVGFLISSLGAGLTFQGKLSDIKNIRRFSSAVARKIVEST